MTTKLMSRKWLASFTHLPPFHSPKALNMASFLNTLLFMILLCIGFLTPTDDSLLFCKHLQHSKSPHISSLFFHSFILLTSLLLLNRRTMAIPVASYGKLSSLASGALFPPTLPPALFFSLTYAF